MIKVNLPLQKQTIRQLHAGDKVLLSGTVLTARDCAHKRIMQYLNDNEPLPFDLKNAVVYYAGPCPAKPGFASGSCGPTTSARMETFAPALIKTGLSAIIGKGEMCGEVRQALTENCGVYFAAVGGAGALYGSAITSCRCIAFGDLLSEAVYKLEIENFPVIVAYDCYGKSIY